MSGYFNLEKSFAFYGAYHSNSLNKVIHVICVPLIFMSSIELLLRIAPPAVVMAIFAFYVISFIKMDALLGVLYSPVLVLYYWLAVHYLSPQPTLSLVIFLCSWMAQFVGHGLFEKRAPALLTNLPQSLHAAVFFVWLELLFALGIKRSLHERLRLAVDRERKQRKFI